MVFLMRFLEDKPGRLNKAGSTLGLGLRTLDPGGKQSGLRVVSPPSFASGSPARTPDRYATHLTHRLTQKSTAYSIAWLRLRTAKYPPRPVVQWWAIAAHLTSALTKAQIVSFLNKNNCDNPQPGGQLFIGHCLSEHCFHSQTYLVAHSE